MMTIDEIKSATEKYRAHILARPDVPYVGGYDTKGAFAILDALVGVVVVQAKEIELLKKRLPPE